jgi:hypothetical protein
MSTGIFRSWAILFFASLCISLPAQEMGTIKGLPVPVIDSLIRSGYILNQKQKTDSVVLNTNQAIGFLQKKLRLQYWKDPADPFRVALGQLVFEASHKPFDTVEVFLNNYPFDFLDVAWDKFYIWEPLRLRIPVIKHPRNLISGDTLAVTELKDTTILVVIDTLREVTSGYSRFPFTYYDYPYQADSIRAAVSLLKEYVLERDSMLIFFTGAGDNVTPVWLNSKSDMMKRHWLRTNLYDSATIWIGSQSRNTFALYLENGISFIRPTRQQVYSDPKVDVQQIDRSKLHEVKKIETRVQYWKYRSEASFALNQASLNNWVKGGESSVSTSLDITGFADYTNKSLKITSNNFGRIKYGLVWNDENGVRKNLDLIETNSKLNHKAFGKFDFSAILLFKTQLSNGYTYAADGSSALVSKFMSPGILTVGFGLDYKPNKKTSINFSPLSYKGTFVMDTTGVKGKDAVDPSKYGIPSGKKARSEPGTSFMITNEYQPFTNITMTNRLQLFTNYLNNPQNIDVDWEMIVTAKLNWFTDVRLNTHLIFDDDTKSIVDPDDPNSKKTARVQFKELLGFSFVFRF